MRYVRLYADSEGETHFEDVEDTMRVEDFAPPAEPFLVSEIRDATRFSFFEFPVGWVGVAHPAPRRQYFAVVQGAIEITVSDGESRIAKVGDVVLAEDTKHFVVTQVNRIAGYKPRVHRHHAKGS